MYPDVETPRVEGESRTEGTWTRDLGRREAEATSARPDEQKRIGSSPGRSDRVSSRRDMAKYSLKRKGCKQTTQLYKQNPENNFEPFETKRPQPS